MITQVKFFVYPKDTLDLSEDLKGRGVIEPRLEIRVNPETNSNVTLSLDIRGKEQGKEIRLWNTIYVTLNGNFYCIYQPGSIRNINGYMYEILRLISLDQAQGYVIDQIMSSIFTDVFVTPFLDIPYSWIRVIFPDWYMLEREYRRKRKEKEEINAGQKKEEKVENKESISGKFKIGDTVKIRRDVNLPYDKNDYYRIGVQTVIGICERPGLTPLYDLHPYLSYVVEEYLEEI